MDGRARVTFVYQLFPNVMIATFPDRVIVVAIDPIDIDHPRSRSTRWPILPWPHIDRPGDSSNGRSLVDQGGIEDNEMSMAVQRGLHAGANSFVEFGRHESAIGHFHRTLDDRLAYAR